MALRILYLKSGVRPLSTFEINDLAILEKLGEPTIVDWRNLPRLFLALRACRLVFRWFADLPAWWGCSLARLFRRPFVVVAGGFDTDCLPEIGYGIGSAGLFDRHFLAPMRNCVLRQADAVLCVSRHTFNQATKLGTQQPYLLYNAVDAKAFHFADYPSPMSRAITVARLNTENIRWKGLDTFIRAAAIVQRQIPAARFAIIGDDDGAADDLATMARAAGARVEICPPGDRENYRRLLADSSVYVQGSVIESFGLALAEAMCCGCCPVVTPCGALPEVAGPSARIFPYGDAEALAEILCSLLRAPVADGDRQAARAHIVNAFSMEQRQREIERVFRQLGFLTDT